MISLEILQLNTFPHSSCVTHLEMISMSSMIPSRTSLVLRYRDIFQDTTTKHRVNKRHETVTQLPVNIESVTCDDLLVNIADFSPLPSHNEFQHSR